MLCLVTRTHRKDLDTGVPLSLKQGALYGRFQWNVVKTVRNQDNYPTYPRAHLGEHDLESNNAFGVVGLGGSWSLLSYPPAEIVPLGGDVEGKKVLVTSLRIHREKVTLTNH